MTASAIAVRLLTSTATSKKGLNFIVYIVLGALLLICFMFWLISPPEDVEAVIYKTAIEEIVQTQGVQGDISQSAIRAVYLLHYGDVPTTAAQINSLICSFFIREITAIDENEKEYTYKRFATKAEMLDRVRLAPFNFDESQYEITYFAFYTSLPGDSENGDANMVIPPMLPCSLKMPCTGAITSAWGYRESPITQGVEELHTGIDICGAWHQPIYATYDGEVVSTNTQKSGYGNYVQIKHSAGSVVFYSFYAHLSQLNVSVGDVLKTGQQIGLEGGDPQNDKNPGDTTGHHLHFELRLQPNRNSTFDPYPYLTK